MKQGKHMQEVAREETWQTYKSANLAIHTQKERDNVGQRGREREREKEREQSRAEE
jgi:hypothetical protein